MHPLREGPPTVTVTAEAAIEALYRRYDLFPPVDQRWVVRLIEGAAEGRLEHPVALATRMLMDLGFTRDALVGALVGLTMRGALRPSLAGPPPDDPIMAPSFVPEPRPDPEPLRNPYLDDVVESDWDYPSGWREAPVDHRVVALGKLFGIPDAERLAPSVPRPSAPAGFGTLVTVSPSWLGRRWGIRDPLGSGYGDLLREAIRVIRGVYRSAGYGFAATMLDLEPCRRIQIAHVARQALHELDRRSGTPFLCYPGQLGRRWRGSSIARVDWHVSYARDRVGDGWKEFPLSAFAVLCELAHEPYRLKNPGVLAIDCPGDAFEGVWGFSMNTGVSLAFGHDNLHLIDRSRSRPDPVFGAATGLIRP